MPQRLARGHVVPWAYVKQKVLVQLWPATGQAGLVCVVVGGWVYLGRVPGRLAHVHIGGHHGRRPWEWLARRRPDGAASNHMEAELGVTSVAAPERHLSDGSMLTYDSRQAIPA